ncbi:tetratricopeptide repeat protein [Pseudoduganella sp. FT25W]|uniref:Tetratricopeptide repeat protein n=1 Tax=Duganella alba TaxID=2666081 RepID=A0A6L5QIC9_9BURK|nr:dienelactone hydrolase family protein [Duganella alba]MRX09420.1 tetratricopeptide repeat protein [Duganella alba]MRX17683.1 tetratricopeptide repeat protein [Duganella alba]
MRNLLLVLLFGVAAQTSSAAGPAFPGGPGRYAVGLRVIQLYDRSRAYPNRIDLVTGMPAQGERARPLQALLWYPAEKQGAAIHYEDYLRSAATEEQFKRTDAEVGKAVATYLQDNYPNLDAQQGKAALAQTMLARRDAPPLAGKFPIVIYAPGSSATAYDNADLCEYLASQGYLVIASASTGMHTRSMSIDLDSAESEARDISFLLGYAATLPQADDSHVAAMGYSFGGLANVLAAARDDRITALVSLDGSVRYFPAIVQQAAYATPERLALPMLYLGGKPYTAELMNRIKQVPTYSLMNQMKFSELYNVTMYTMEHAAFQSESLRLGPEPRFGEYSRDEATLAHGWMGRYVLAFLNAYLRNDDAALAFMNNKPAANSVPAHLLAVDVHHAEGEPPTLTTMASRFARHGHKDLAGIYRDMHQRDASFKPDERGLIAWGEKFLDVNRYPEAIEIYQLTTSLYPDSGRAMFYLAMTYERHHDNALALEAYQRVLGFWPDMAEAKQSIAKLKTAEKDGQIK